MAAINKPSHQMQEWLQDLASKKPGAAKSDSYAFSETKLEKSGIVLLDVMGNDAGGNNKHLFAVSNSATPDQSLLQRDAAYTSVGNVTNWEYSSNGARFAIVNGKIAYDASSSSTFATLAQGEKMVDHITYAIVLPNGHLSFTTVAITITGTNDVPVFQSSYVANSYLSEDADPGNGTTVTTYGAFTVTDQDLSDTVTASVKAVHLSGTVGSLTAAQVMSLFTLQQSSLTADWYESSNLGWNFNADETTFDFLKDGEQLTLTYDVKVTDNHGASATQSATINISGITDLPYNVAPVVAIKDGDSAGQSLSEGTGQNVPLSATGSLSVSDANHKDALSVTVKGVTVDDPTHSITADQVLNLLQLGSIYQPQADHNLQWSFSTTSGLFDHLQPGENVTLTYSVEVADGKGGVTLAPITMVITGSGEAPVVSLGSGDVREAIMFEDGTPISGAIATVTPTSISAHGTLTVTDPDGSSGGGAMTAKILYVNGGGGLYDVGWTPPETWFSVNIDPTKATNNLSWTFNVDPKFLDHIPANSNTGITCAIEVDDGSGNKTMTFANVIVVGLNDAPVRVETPGDIVNATASSDTPSATGHFTYYDADLGDTVYVQPHAGGFSVTGNLGTHTADELLNYATSIHAHGIDTIYTGGVDWAYNAPAGTFDYLAPGETVTMNYTFDVWDGHPGSFFTQSFSVTIVGAQDLPV